MYTILSEKHCFITVQSQFFLQLSQESKPNKSLKKVILGDYYDLNFGYINIRVSFE